MTRSIWWAWIRCFCPMIATLPNTSRSPDSSPSVPVGGIERSTSVVRVIVLVPTGAKRFVS